MLWLNFSLSEMTRFIYSITEKCQKNKRIQCYICHAAKLVNMKNLKVVVFTATLLLTGISYAQQDVHSGILHTTSSGEESNLIKLHCENLTEDMVATIRSEYKKYPEIRSVDFQASDYKIYVKYSNDIGANMLLGILERVYIKAYYLDVNGNEVRYTKTGYESFKR